MYATTSIRRSREAGAPAGVHCLPAKAPRTAPGVAAVCLLLLLAASCSPGARTQEARDISGTWLLNHEQSTFRRKDPPSRVQLTIEHVEPRLSYSGFVGGEQGGGMPFAADIIINGEPQVINQETGVTMSAKRTGPGTIVTVQRSADGRYEETARNVLSDDGRKLTRHIAVVEPQRRTAWTEVYDKVE
jgi:hypothetical protein